MAESAIKDSAFGSECVSLGAVSWLVTGSVRAATGSAVRGASGSTGAASTGSGRISAGRAGGYGAGGGGGGGGRRGGRGGGWRLRRTFRRVRHLRRLLGHVQWRRLHYHRLGMIHGRM